MTETHYLENALESSHSKKNHKIMSFGDDKFDLLGLFMSFVCFQMIKSEEKNVSFKFHFSHKGII